MMSKEGIRDLVQANVSRDRCILTLQELLRVASPQTALLEAEPVLRTFIEKEVEPRLRKAFGGGNYRYDAMGNLICEIGESPSPSLMLIAHAMNQPPNTMPNPYEGEILDGRPFGFNGEVVRGRGASEQKGTMAAMLHALDSVASSGMRLKGRLVFVCCVSGETGKIDAIQNVVEVEGVRADIAVLYGNSLKLQIGNRGRIDLGVTVRGKASHSSRPKDGCNAVTGAMEVLRQISEMYPKDRRHPALGDASLTVNGLRSFPDSTHTIQDRCEISLDRRLLPGESPDEAAAEVEAIVMRVNGMLDPASGRPWTVSLTRGAFMHPSLVTAASPAVSEVSAACQTMLGYVPEEIYAHSAFDQGYLNHVGISTLNFGPGEQSFAHTDNDIASADRVFDAARVFAFLVASYLQADEPIRAQ
jgi:acetylornithine deacetylase/succinyl-diaminopimelate desuccinylase-like protein